MMDRYFIPMQLGIWGLVIFTIDNIPKIDLAKRITVAGLVIMQFLHLTITEEYFKRPSKEQWREVLIEVNRDTELSQSAVAYCQWHDYYSYYLKQIPLKPLLSINTCDSADFENTGWVKTSEINKLYVVYGNRKPFKIELKNWRLIKQRHYLGAGYYQYELLDSAIKQN